MVPQVVGPNEKVQGLIAMETKILNTDITYSYLNEAGGALAANTVPGDDSDIPETGNGLGIEHAVRSAALAHWRMGSGMYDGRGPKTLEVFFYEDNERLTEKRRGAEFKHFGPWTDEVTESCLTFMLGAFKASEWIRDED